MVRLLEDGIDDWREVVSEGLQDAATRFRQAYRVDPASFTLALV
jgi:hypothetical protein